LGALRDFREFIIGDFINALVAFIIVAAVVFFLIVRPVNSLMNMYKKPEPAVSDLRDCPFCKSSISKAASRCPYCTSEVQVLERA
jgi:large conductance mechanosensitive channel